MRTYLLASNDRGNQLIRILTWNDTFSRITAHGRPVLVARHNYLNPKSRQNNGPIPSNIGQKAIILRTFGVQVPKTLEAHTARLPDALLQLIVE